LLPDTVPVVAGPVEELFELAFAPPVLPSVPGGGMGPVLAVFPVVPPIPLALFPVAVLSDGLVLP
jgi:hypothetical protein